MAGILDFSGGDQPSAGLLGNLFADKNLPALMLAGTLLSARRGDSLGAPIAQFAQMKMEQQNQARQMAQANLQQQLLQQQITEGQRQIAIRQAMDAAAKNSVVAPQQQMLPTDQEIPSGPQTPAGFDYNGYINKINAVDPGAALQMRAQLMALNQKPLMKVGPGETIVNTATEKPVYSVAPKPVMVDNGASIIPTDPSTGKPIGAPIPKAIGPSDVYRRGTQFAIAGLDANGSPSGDIEQVAQAIASGNMAPLSSFAMSHPRGQQIMARVYQINPQYDATEFNAKNKATSAFATGKQGDTVRFIGVALTHGDQLAQAAQALQNGNIPLFNQVANAYATQTGQPAPNNFDAVKNIYKNEVTKAILGGAGALGDRQEVEKTIDKANSPAQLLGVMQQYQGLLRGQLGGLKRQYEQTTGRTDFERFLSPEAKRLEGGGQMPTLEEINAEIARRGGK